MRSKLVLAALVILTTLQVHAQVAPAAKISGIPLGVGGGLADYSVDYGPDRRMIGLSAWAEYNIFHGLGVAAEGSDIFAGKPSELTRMNQKTAKGGAIYKSRPFYGVRPYGKFLYGIGSIDFPSRNPLYTHDRFSMYAMGGGGEYRVWRTVYARADYEYQFWPNYFGKHTLNPNGITIGATYYLRGTHRHY